MSQAPSLLRPMHLVCLTLLPLMLACSEDTATGGTVTQRAQASPQTTAAQALVDPAGPNYVVVGGSFVDLVGGDRSTEKAAGRLVNQGDGISASSVNAEFWIVLGNTGKMTALDREGNIKDATPRAPLAELGGPNTPAYFAAYGTRGNASEPVWLVGGGQGQVAYVDGATATPFLSDPNTKKQLFGGNVDLLDAAFDPQTDQWLVGASGGQLVSLVASSLTEALKNEVLLDTPVERILTNPDGASPARWLVITQRQSTLFPTGTPQPFEAGITASAAASDGVGKVLLGSADGRVMLRDFAQADQVGGTWVMGLPKAVESIQYNGTEWLVLGKEGWARVFDAMGMPKTNAVQLGDGSDLTAATWNNGRWLIGSARSIIFEVNASLETPATYTDLLDGKKILATASGSDRLVIAGEGGAYRLLTPLGEPLGAVRITPGNATIYDVSWDGDDFLMVGEGGKATLIDKDGAPKGEGWTMLGGKTARVAAWNGTFWLVAGDAGTVQRLRENGEVTGEPLGFDDIEVIHAAGWNGEQWMVAGTLGGEGRVRFVTSDGKSKNKAQAIPFIDTIYALDWSGFEWIVGGSGGRVQLVSAAGLPRPMPMGDDVLFGQTVRSILFHDKGYLVAGDSGLVRFLGEELQLLGTPLALAKFEDIYDTAWTRPRGYGTGECLSDTACYKGRCLENQAGAKFCCDVACDRGCESCLKTQNNMVDGLCAPFVAGAMPLTPSVCPVQPESSCGRTGVCDGSGECQLYAATVVCQAASCEQGKAAQAVLCDGQGMCAAQTSTECSPYTGCSEAGVCQTSCTGDTECVEGFFCNVAGLCVSRATQPPMDMGMGEDMAKPPVAKTSTGDGDGGCATASAPISPKTALPYGLLGLMLLGVRRRRRRA